MNRNSLFGRLSSKFAASATASRPEFYRPQIEPLEVRKVLATFYANDNWHLETPGPVTMGATVTSANDPVANVTAVYGFTAFGRVTTNVTTGPQFLTQGLDPNSVAVPYDMQYIYSAIQTAANNNNDTVSIIEGTYTESDIVVNKSRLTLKGSGRLNTPGNGGAYVAGTDTLIVPETASTKAEEEFPVGSRSGVIVYASDVNVFDFRLDGGGSFNYHHGVTTLYEQQGGSQGNGGSDYSSLRAGDLIAPRRRTITYSGTTVTTSVANGVADAGWTTGDSMYFYSTDGVNVPSPLVEGQEYWINVTGVSTFTVHNSQSDANTATNPINFTGGAGTQTALSSKVYGDIVEGTGSTRPQLQFHHITVDNAWYHGVTMSGPAGMQFDEDNGDGTGRPDNEVFNVIVNNVGDPGNQGDNHIGILIQNVDSYRTGDPGGAPSTIPGGNAYNNIVNNAGVGISGNAYGAREWSNDNQARNDSTYYANTVNNPKVAAYHLEFIDGVGFINNFATFTNGVGIGIRANQLSGSILGNTIGTPGNAPLIGMKIENSNSAQAFGSGVGIPTIGNTKFQGPGTTVAGSIGILADNDTGTNRDASFLATYTTVVSGFAIGVNSKQTNPSAVPNTALVDRMNVTGNAVGFEFGPTAGGTVQVAGQANIPGVASPFTLDPVIMHSGATMANGWLPNITEQTAHQLQVNPVPPVLTNAMMTLTGATGTLVTVSTNYSWSTGMGVRIRDDQNLVGAQMPTGIVDNQRYWIHNPGVDLGSNIFSLHNSHADAIANANPVGGLDFSTAVGTIRVEELVVPGTLGLPQPGYVVTEAAGARPDETPTGNLTLNSGATYAPFLGGDTGTASVTINDFNSSLGWTASSLASDIDRVNPWGFGFIPRARLGFWAGGANAVNQNGASGSLRIYDQLGGPGGVETGGVYELTTVQNDVREMGYMRVIAKLGLGVTTSDEFLVTLVDVDGTSDLHYFPTALMNTTTYTTFYSSVLAPSIRFVDGDNIANLSSVAGWAVSGAFGSTDGAGATDRLSLVVDDISYTPSPRSSVYKVTGTVNINGATLDPQNVGMNLYVGGVGGIGQQFTIIDNDLADAVVGTFAGLPEGATMDINGDEYTISYVGGTGNDVVLTQTGVATIDSTVEGRHIFYNQSTFDGNSAAINANDNNAIATNKSPLFIGAGQAQLANITNFTRGINGIMVDLSTGVDHSGITAADFIFKVGANNTPSSWAVAPAPSALSVTAGGGVSGADRVTITWADNAIANQYLQVAVRANANTGLAPTGIMVDPDGPGAATAVDVGDLFFYGHLMGETIASTPAGNFARTAAADGGAILANGTQFNVGITNTLDINKSNSVTAAADRGPILAAGTQFLTRISIGTTGPFAPEGDDGGDAGIASALATTSDDSPEASSLVTTALPRGIGNRLQTLDLNSGRIAAFFQHLADQDTPGTRKLLTRIDEVAGELGLDHDLLDDLVAGL